MRAPLPVVAFALALPFACDRRSDAPAPTADKPLTLSSSSASVIASASSAPSTSSSIVASAQFEGLCRNGQYVGYLAATDSGDSGVGLPGTGAGGGGWGDGIGLGSVGGKPPTPIAGEVVEGKAETADAVAHAICDHVADLRACFDALKARGAKTPAGDVVANLTVEGEHVKDAAITGGTITDATFTTCLAGAYSALATPGAAAGTLTYAARFPATSTSTVKLVQVASTITGKLPPDPVLRVLRANFPRFRACYENGLKSDPGSKGVAQLRFTIDETGAVEAAAPGPATTLKDAAIVSCEVGVVRALSFPEPDAGKVLVLYSIDESVE